MDKKILVDGDIQQAKILITELDQANFRLQGALWFYFSETADWKLLFASPLVDTAGPRTCYRMVQTALASMPRDFGIALEQISVISPNDRLIQLLRMAIRTGPGLSTIRFAGNTINGVYIHDALIYRLF